MADDVPFADRQEAQDFLSLLLRHWNNIVRILQEEDVFLPLLFKDGEGTAYANDWARGFMRGVRLHQESRQELFDDKEHGGPLVPILVLAHEHDADPEMRPYQGNIDVERREKLILGIAAGVTAIYRYFAPQRRRMAEGLAAQGTAYRHAERKTDATILAPAAPARNTNTAAGHPPFDDGRKKPIGSSKRRRRRGEFSLLIWLE
jgi:uncharacterized protein